MAKRAAIPGTDHSTTIHRDEVAIIKAISHTEIVTKVEPLYIRWTGTTKTRLCLQHTSSEMVQAWLFLGHAKRMLLIGLRPRATMQVLQQALAMALRHFRVDVQIRAN